MVVLNLFRHPLTRHPRFCVWPTHFSDISSVRADQNLLLHQNGPLKYCVQPNNVRAHNTARTSRPQTTHIDFLREPKQLPRPKLGTARHRPKSHAWDRGIFTYTAWLPRPGRAVCLHTPRGKLTPLRQPRLHSGQHVPHEIPK